MYFIEQLRNQFLYNLHSFQVPEGVGIVQQTAEGKTEPKTPEQVLADFGVSKEDYDKLNPENQKLVSRLTENIQSLNESGQGLSLEAKFLSMTVRILDKLETDPLYKPQWPEEAKEYAQMLEKLKSFKTRLAGVETQKIDTQRKIVELSSQIDGLTHSVENVEVVVDMTAEDNDFQTSNERKSQFFTEIISLWDVISKEQAENIFTVYSPIDIHTWSQEVESNSAEATSIQKLFAAIDARSIENVTELQSMKVQEFLGKIPHEDRLLYFSHTWPDFIPEKGGTIDFTFRFAWVHNWELESWMTAWGILPETVSQVKVWDTIYERKWLQWEFISVSEEGKTPTRLTIREGDSIIINEVKTQEQISVERKKIDAELEWTEGRDKDIRKQLLLKWIHQLDNRALRIINKTVWDTSGWIEKTVSTIASTPWIEWGGLEKIEGGGVIWAIINMIIDALGAEWFGKTEDVSWLGSVNDYIQESWWKPLTAEELAVFGNTWSQLAAWIRSINYRKFVNKPWNCGANVGEALEAFGMKWLPQSGRHWYLWGKFCAERPNQFKEYKGTPYDAPAWAIISYSQNTGWSAARQKYGHVEIAMWNNTWFYFGQKNTRPGGSNPNPKPGDYRIYVPVSKTS